MPTPFPTPPSTSIADEGSQGGLVEGTSPTPVENLLTMQPMDDAGAQTADRYEWQAAMAAADALGLYYDYLDGKYAALIDAKIQIICELHEDWLIQLGGEVQLVSAKHRDLQAGPWKSANDLVVNGGLGHLFERWFSADKRPTARLVTNQACAAGEAMSVARCHELLRKESQGMSLTKEEETQRDRAIISCCRALMKHAEGLPHEWRSPDGAPAKSLIPPTALKETVTQFLAVLRIDEQRPSRSDLGLLGPGQYARPLAIKAGYGEPLAATIWEATLALFRVKMRARGEVQRGELPVVGDGNLDKANRDRLLEERAVSFMDLQNAIDTGTRHPDAFKEIALPPNLTKLSMKMVRGGCADTSIERAEALRLDYSAYRRERRNAAPGGVKDLKEIEAILHGVADEETYEVRTPDHLWGAHLWHKLSKRFSAGVHELESYEVSGLIGLGGVCQLTSECKVWFSERFDVQAGLRVARVRMNGGRGETDSIN